MKGYLPTETEEQRRLPHDGAIPLLMALGREDTARDRLDSILEQAQTQHPPLFDKDGNLIIDKNYYTAPAIVRQIICQWQYLTALVDEGLPFSTIPERKRDLVYQLSLEDQARLSDPARRFADSYGWLWMTENKGTRYRSAGKGHWDVFATIFRSTSFVEDERPSEYEYEMFEFPEDVVDLAREARALAIKNRPYRISSRSSDGRFPPEVCKQKVLETAQLINEFYRQAADYVFQHFDETKYFVEVLGRWKI